MGESPWCPVFHFHQPPYDDSTMHYYHECAANSYSHHLGVLERHPDTRVTYNISGVLLEMMERRNPELIGRFREGIEKGQICLTGTSYSHAILPIIFDQFGEEAVRLQIEKDLQLKKRLFGTEPKVFRLPEYAVSNPVVKIAGDYFDYILVSGVTFGGAGLPYGTAVKKGEIKLVCRDDCLSNLLAGMHHDGTNYFESLKNGRYPRDIAEDFSCRVKDAHYALTDFDGEAIMHHMLVCGVLPEKAERYMDELFDAAERNGIRTVHVPEFAEALPVFEKDFVVPTSSYDPNGLFIWQGREEHDSLWESIKRTWELYTDAKELAEKSRLDGDAKDILERMQENALKAQTSCFTWAVTYGYPGWWAEQPEKYAAENEEQLRSLTAQR